MTTLHLPITKHWFDLIKSGTKKEEYREIKPYWIIRLIANKSEMEYAVYDEFCTCLKDYTKNFHSLDELLDFFECKIKQFDTITFINGYSKKAQRLIVPCKGITIGKPKPEWCCTEIDYNADTNTFADCFIIKL